VFPRAGFAVAALCLASPARAQDLSLAFLGFRAGAPLAAADAQAQLLLGTPLACNRSRVDPRVQDCRASFTDPRSGNAVSVWLAAIDSVAGIVSLSAALTGGELEQWRQAIEAAYGRRAATTQGPQVMVQWVRETQMLRLTWRAESGRFRVSVSLVDGPVLEGWTLGEGDSARIAKPPTPG